MGGSALANGRRKRREGQLPKVISKEGCLLAVLSLSLFILLHHTAPHIHRVARRVPSLAGLNYESLVNRGFKSLSLKKKRERFRGTLLRPLTDARRQTAVIHRTRRASPPDR